MRLINVQDFTLQEFADAGTTPPYAILSHTWGANEVAFHDIQDLDEAQSKDAFYKIRCSCLQAEADGLHYVWVDTCCIDKSSSHELSEAINSMYRWYMNAEVCYVYLSDVSGSCPALDGDYVLPSHLRYVDMFEESRWFTRGWTLQELLAPRSVLFFGCAWNPLGALPDLIDRVSSITQIQRDVLDHTRPIADVSVARRLSWAAERTTTRKEDEAYCLLGILDVNMPLLYGEGPKAFLRLQEEIVRHSTDQSLFAWDVPAGPVASRELLFAPAPRCFKNCSKIRRRRGTASESAFHLSNKGLEITLPIVFQRLELGGPNLALGILDCKYEGSTDVLALAMKQHPFNLQSGSPALDLYVSGYDRQTTSGSQYTRLAAIHPSSQAEAIPRLMTVTRDLQSQTYVQAFSSNAPSWFPIRFTGSDTIPVLQGVWPEDCWYQSSRTLRLPDSQRSYGGLVVSIRGTTSVLIPVDYIAGSRGQYTGARSIGEPVRCDPFCPIGAHLESLKKRESRHQCEATSIRLNEHEQLLAQLRDGALVVSVERIRQDSGSSSHSRNTLSPPSSPRSSAGRPNSWHGSPPASPYGLSPQTSPRAFSKQPITPMSMRRDSILHDGQQYTSVPQEVHRTDRCAHCREVWASERAVRARQEEERAKAEKQRKFRARAKQAGIGVSIGSILTDLSGVAEYL